MIRGDLLTVKNAQNFIFRQQTKLFSLERFDWLEPIVGLFHLQMNLLSILFNKL